MRIITPSERLVIKSGREAYRMAELPSVIIVQISKANGKDGEEKAYLVRSRNWRKYVKLTSALPDTVEAKGWVAEKLGRPIAVKAFEDATAYQTDFKTFTEVMGDKSLKEGAYSVYATEFKKIPRSRRPESVD